jgi:hypothetical protein
MPKLSIIIPVYNNYNYTKYVLNNLLPLDYEIIIVDNNSSDLTNEFSKLNIKYIRNSENKFFGYACNQGYKIASSNLIMFLNNDIKILDKNFKWLEDFISYCEGVDYPALIGPTGGYVNPNTGYGFMYETEDSNKKINYMSGWCLTAKKEVWNCLILDGLDGPFDSRNFILYFEDTDLSFRAREKDIKFLLYKLPLTHIGKQTSKNLNINKYYSESKKKFLQKWQKINKTLI